MEQIIQNISIWALPIIFAITVHEVAHGYVAKKLGDNTAYILGRLTLNPIKHIDLMGTLIVPIVLLIITKGMFVFGWAKPVPINNRNLKRPKRDMALVAAAGPISNLIMALGWALILKVGLLLKQSGAGYWEAVALMGSAGILVNLVLAVLNLIPIPPLDGSRILSSFLSAKLDYYYHKLEPWGFFILIGLILIGAFQYIIGPPVYALFHFLLHIFNINPSLFQ